MCVRAVHIHMCIRITMNVRRATKKKSDDDEGYVVLATQTTVALPL